MASQRRKISKEERKQRDALMRVHHWVVVLVLRRLFDAGWDNERVVLAFDRVQHETGRLCLVHAMPDWHWVDEKQVADEVYELITTGDGND